MLQATWVFNEASFKVSSRKMEKKIEGGFYIQMSSVFASARTSPMPNIFMLILQSKESNNVTIDELMRC